tara:strand:- start:1749 stop:1961 length:213 start_codon:yes stop_codon:yes gene_type:complete
MSNSTSKKQQRISKLISIYNALNSPISGAGSSAQQCTYRKSTVMLLMQAVTDTLKLDGVVGLKSEDGGES